MNKENVDKLIDIFGTYDNVDLISKIVALNFEFENQNKSAMLVFATIVGLSLNNSKKKPFASKKTVNNVINILNNLNIMPPILDPAESSFFETLLLDREYHVFNGYNQSSFHVSKAIELLLYRKTNLPLDFKNKALQFIKCLLSISDDIWKRLGIDWDDIKDHNNDKDLLMTDDIERKSKLLYVDKSFFLSFIDNNEVDKYFICNDMVNYNRKTLIKDFSRDEAPFYYSCPFYKVDENNYLLLDPTSVCDFIKSLIIRFANEYGCLEMFIDEYHNHVFEMASFDCIAISGASPQELRVPFKHHNNYKQKSYPISDNKILYIGYSYSRNVSPLTFSNMNVDSYLKKDLHSLEECGYKNDQVYIVLLTSVFSGAIGFTSSFRPVNSMLTVDSSQIHYIYLNEKSNPFYLEEYSNFLNYYFPNNKLSMVFSQICLIQILKSKNYDFYINDDINIKTETFLNLGFDFVYPYVISALVDKSESVASFKGIGVPLRLLRKDDYSYTLDVRLSIVVDSELLFTKVNDYGFWFISKRGNNYASVVSNAVSYWFSEIKHCLTKIVSKNHYILVEVGEHDAPSVRMVKEKCLLLIPLSYLDNFKNLNNYAELDIATNILMALGLYSECIKKEFDRLSHNPKQNAIQVVKPDDPFFLFPVNSSLLLPSKNSPIIDSILGDKIGDYLVKEKRLSIGKIENPNDAMHTVVEYLFKMFEDYMSNFNWKDSCKRLYLHCEDLMQKILISQSSMQNRIAVSPHNKNNTILEYGEWNTAVISARFITEYVGAVHVSGTRSMDDVDIQYAISLVTSIIKWARISDAIKYGVEKGDINLLKSHRVGLNHENIELFSEMVTDVSIDEMVTELDLEQSFDSELPSLIDNAYIFEHGFNMQQLVSVISVLFGYGDNISNEIKEANINDIILTIPKEGDYSLDEGTFLNIVDFLSIKQRQTYLGDGTIAYRHLYPWRYGREYSLLRKPIIKDGDTLIWGNRLLLHSYLFIKQTIMRGKEPSKMNGPNSISVLNGKILDKIGEDFNNQCLLYLRKIAPTITFEKEIVSLNNKRIADEKGQTLGDIDILGIDREKHRIYLIETKNFFYSKDFNELSLEIEDMFGSPNRKRKSYLELEINRYNWVVSHIDDVKKHYKLDDKEWKAVYTFLTRSPLISCAFTNYNINHIDIRNITLKYLRKLK